jgi:hypothetical protein
MRQSERYILLIILIAVIIYFACYYNSKTFEGLQNVEAHVIGHDDQEKYNPRPYDPIVPVHQPDYLPIDTVGQGNSSLGYTGMCSKHCCSPGHWPYPFELEPDYVSESGQKFSPSSYSCNNTVTGAGCLCLPPEKSLYMSRRGGNFVDAGL